MGRRRPAASVPGNTRVVLTDSPRRFVVLGPDSSYWEVGPQKWDEELLAGAFVRLRPPPGTSPELAREAERQVKRFGAAATKLDLPNADDAAVAREAPAEESTCRDERATVERMVGEARTADREALRAECERAMAAVGL